MIVHKAKYEATNNGHYFVDCACGWGAQVYPSRTIARQAFAIHTHNVTTVEGEALVEIEPVKPTFLPGGRIVGQRQDEA